MFLHHQTKKNESLEQTNAPLFLRFFAIPWTSAFFADVQSYESTNCIRFEIFDTYLIKKQENQFLEHILAMLRACVCAISNYRLIPLFYQLYARPVNRNIKSMPKF